MSNSNNLGKEIKRLRKEIADLGAQDSAFHFVVGDANENAEAKLDGMRAAGKVQPGDTCQLIHVPWVIYAAQGINVHPRRQPARSSC